jgi:assimilatory nitrate reductase catalytic subunit
VVVQSSWGEAIARAQINEGQQQGAVFMPMHWTGVLTFSAPESVQWLILPLTLFQDNLKTNIRPSASVVLNAAWHGYLLSDKSH